MASLSDRSNATSLVAYLRERTGARLRILRLLPSIGKPLLVGSIALQVVTGLVPVAFIVTSSAVVGRVPAAIENGLGSPEWTSLRNALLVTGALFLLQQLVFPLHWTLNEAIAWKVDDVVRERLLEASFRPAGVGALEDEQTIDELRDVVDPLRGAGFAPGSACAGLLALIARYQWALAAAFVGYVFALGGARCGPLRRAVRAAGGGVPLSRHLSKTGGLRTWYIPGTYPVRVYAAER